jgi:MFS family permease
MLVPLFGLLLATTFFAIVGVLVLRLAGMWPLRLWVLITFVIAAVAGALAFGAVYGALFADADNVFPSEGAVIGILLGMPVVGILSGLLAARWLTAHQRVSPRFAVARVVSTVMVLGAAVLALRYRQLEVERAHRSAVRALTRDLRDGMTLEEVTGYLRQRGIAFTVDSGDGAPIITGIGRGSTSGDRITTSTEQQIEFDAQRRLRGFRTAATIQSR